METLPLSSRELARALFIALALGIAGMLLGLPDPVRGLTTPEIASAVVFPPVEVAPGPVLRSVAGASLTSATDWLDGVGKLPVASSSSEKYGLTAATPSQKSSLHQSWQLRYFDDFSDPNSGWPIDDNPDREYSYYDGEYRIFLKSSNYWAMVRAGPSLGDAAVEAEARLATRLFGTYGLLFGINDDWSQIYTFEADTRGTYRIWKWDALQERWTLIRERSSAYINPGQEVNRLRVERVGNQVSFYANDHFLTTEHIPALLGARRMGIAAWSYETRQVDARFDNFKIFSAVEPSPTATNTPIPTATQTVPLPTETPTATPTGSVTPTATQTATPTATQTAAPGVFIYQPLVARNSG